MPFRHVASSAVIATTQPVRLGDRASDTIRNATIRSRETFAEVTLQVPLTADLGAAVDGLREDLRVRTHGRLRALGVWG